MLRNNHKILTYALSVLGSISIIAWLIWSLSIVMLNESECAVVLRFGEITTVLNRPGINYVIPLIDSYRSMSKNHSIDVQSLTGETRTVMITVSDPKQFYLTVQGNHEILERRLSSILKDYQRSGGTLQDFIRKFNKGDFRDNGVRLEID